MIKVGDMVRLIECTQDVDPPEGTTGIVIEVSLRNVLVQWKYGTARRNAFGRVGIDDIAGRWWVLPEYLKVVR